MSTPDTNTSPRKSSGGLMKWFLMGSVALNLLLIGLIGGAVWTRYEKASFRNLENEFIHSLPQEKRADVQQIFRAHRTRLRSHRRQIRQEWRSIRRLMRSEDYNREALSPLLDEIMTTHTALIKFRYEMITSLAEKLTAEERRRFMRMWRKRLRHMRRRGRR